MSRLIDKALEYASEKHKGQLDDQGRPYFFAHVVQVYGILQDVTDDEEIICAGILHDVIEDTDTVMVKFADRLSNLSRMEDWPGDRQEQYLKMSRFWPTEPPGDKIVSPNTIWDAP